MDKQPKQTLWTQNLIRVFFFFFVFFFGGLGGWGVVFKHQRGNFLSAKVVSPCKWWQKLSGLSIPLMQLFCLTCFIWIFYFQKSTSSVKLNTMISINFSLQREVSLLWQILFSSSFNKGEGIQLKHHWWENGCHPFERGLLSTHFSLETSKRVIPHSADPDQML